MKKMKNEGENQKTSRHHNIGVTCARRGWRIARRIAYRACVYGARRHHQAALWRSGMALNSIVNAASTTRGENAGSEKAKISQRNHL